MFSFELLRFLALMLAVYAPSSASLFGVGLSVAPPLLSFTFKPLPDEVLFRAVLLGVCHDLVSSFFRVVPPHSIARLP